MTGFGIWEVSGEGALPQHRSASRGGGGCSRGSSWKFSPRFSAKEYCIASRHMIACRVDTTEPTDTNQTKGRFDSKRAGCGCRPSRERRQVHAGYPLAAQIVCPCAVNTPRSKNYRATGKRHADRFRVQTASGAIYRLWANAAAWPAQGRTVGQSIREGIKLTNAPLIVSQRPATNLV